MLLKDLCIKGLVSCMELLGAVWMSGDRCTGCSTSHWRKTLVHPLSILPGHYEVHSFALLHVPRHDMLSLHRPETVRPVGMNWNLWLWDKVHLSSLYLIIYYSTESWLTQYYYTQTEFVHLVWIWWTFGLFLHFD